MQLALASFYIHSHPLLFYMHYHYLISNAVFFFIYYFFFTLFHLIYSCLLFYRKCDAKTNLKVGLQALLFPSGDANLLLSQAITDFI